MTDREMIAHILRMVESQGHQLNGLVKVIDLTQMDKDFQALSEARVGFVEEIEKLREADLPGIKAEIKEGRTALSDSRLQLQKESWESLLRHGIVWILVGLVTGGLVGYFTGKSVGKNAVEEMKTSIESAQLQKLEEEHWSVQNPRVCDPLSSATKEELDLVLSMTDCMLERQAAKKDSKKMSCLPKALPKPKGGKSK